MEFKKNEKSHLQNKLNYSESLEYRMEEGKEKT